MNINLAYDGPWGILAALGLSILMGKIRLVPGNWWQEMKAVIELVRQARDEEHNARVKAEQQRDELLAKYAKTTTQVLEALPIPAPAPGTEKKPGGDPDGVAEKA